MQSTYTGLENIFGESGKNFQLYFNLSRGLIIFFALLYVNTRTDPIAPHLIYLETLLNIYD